MSAVPFGPTEQQLQLLRMVATAIIQTVRDAGPLGAPGGVIFAALSAQGCTLSQYQSLISGLVQAGKLARDGDLYRVAEGV
jgi:hypothetical protein